MSKIPGPGKPRSPHTNPMMDRRDHLEGLGKFRPSSQIGVGGLSLGPRERDYLNQVIQSNRLSYGPFTRQFESLFGSLHECQYAVFCSSGTSALHIAVAALKEVYGWQDEDEILVPATTFISTSNVVLHNRMRPVFVDVDSATYNINPNLIEEKITPRTRAIIPVHLMGLPADMDPINDIARRHNIRVIEDSCETMFASYRGRKVGSIGDIGCFSTYIAHFIVAGIGGFATTNDPRLAGIMRSLINHGRDPVYLSIDDDRGLSKEKLWEVVASRFSFVRLGYNFRATEMEAAIGLAQLEERDHIVRIRRENALYFIDKLADLGERLQLPSLPSDRDHMFMLFPIVSRNEPKRDLVRFLEQNMIETRDMFPLLSQPLYRQIFGDIESEYPVASYLGERSFYIGCHQYLTGDERAFIVEQIYEYFRARS